MSPPVRRHALLVVLALAACTDDPSASDAREDQIQEAAEDAGLADDVVDVLELAAAGVDGTFQVTYAGEDGTSLVISQDPPNRRIDVVVVDQLVESRVFRDGVGYLCEPPSDDPGGSLECRRAEGALDAPGAFTAEAMTAFTDDLIESLDDVDLSVEERTIAEARATCLVSVPKAGPTDATGPGVETICLSARARSSSSTRRAIAWSPSAYTTDVPEGTFDT